MKMADMIKVADMVTIARAECHERLRAAVGDEMAVAMMRSEGFDFISRLGITAFMVGAKP